MNANDSGSAEEMFSCGMCGGSGRIVRGNDGINIRCPDCQGEGKTFIRPSRPNRPSTTPNRTSGRSGSHPPDCDCASYTLLRTVEIPEEKSSPIKRLLRRIFDR